jgi:hypothetical protein
VRAIPCHGGDDSIGGELAETTGIRRNIQEIVKSVFIEEKTALPV